jgi:threonine dehydrogenase-like Zn-dependent dehydrogenase
MVSAGLLWIKALSINGGVAETCRLQPILQRLIECGRAKPSFIIDEVLHSLEEVPHAYKRFARREIGKPVIQLPSSDNDLANGYLIVGAMALLYQNL